MATWPALRGRATAVGSRARAVCLPRTRLLEACARASAGVGGRRRGRRSHSSLRALTLRAPRHGLPARTSGGRQPGRAGAGSAACVPALPWWPRSDSLPFPPPALSETPCPLSPGPLLPHRLPPLTDPPLLLPRVRPPAPSPAESRLPSPSLSPAPTPGLGFLLTLLHPLPPLFRRGGRGESGGKGLERGGY